MKLFRAYGLYNYTIQELVDCVTRFQSSFELTGYITIEVTHIGVNTIQVSKLFRAYGLYNEEELYYPATEKVFQSSFELTGYITLLLLGLIVNV